MTVRVEIPAQGGGEASEVLDRDKLADLINEGIQESRRHGDTGSQITWLDAAEAADLLLRHVNNLVRGDVD